MKTKMVLVILFSMLIFVGGSKNQLQTSNSQNQLLEPKQVVENYFKYYNEKNKEGVISTLTEWHNSPNVVWEFDNLKYIKINSIKEDINPKDKEAYMKYGRGMINGVKEENVIIYTVEYEVKYKKDGVGSQDSGNYTWGFTVIRKDKYSPWLIDDFGEG